MMGLCRPTHCPNRKLAFIGSLASMAPAICLQVLQCPKVSGGKQTVWLIKKVDLTTWPEPSALCPTSEFPMSSSDGKPTWQHHIRCAQHVQGCNLTVMSRFAEKHKRKMHLPVIQKAKLEALRPCHGP